MKPSEIFKAALIGVLLYAAVSGIVFRFRHPWMTETELIIHTMDSVLWRTVEKPST
jgi:hypothetical protein